MYCFLKKGEQGFSLIELLIATVISLVLFTSLFTAFIMQRKAYNVQEQITEMMQVARAAMDMMGREIKVAGYDLAGLMQKTDPSAADFVGIPYDTSQLEVVADLNADGDTSDPNEDIVYAYYTASKQIKRKTGAGSFQPFAEDIQSYQFEYLDSSGNAATTTANIRRIKITITARTAHRDPNYSPNGGYRTYTLTSLIVPTNLAY